MFDWNQFKNIFINYKYVFIYHNIFILEISHYKIIFLFFIFYFYNSVFVQIDKSFKIETIYFDFH